MYFLTKNFPRPRIATITVVKYMYILNFLKRSFFSQGFKILVKRVHFLATWNTLIVHRSENRQGKRVYYFGREQRYVHVEDIRAKQTHLDNFANATVHQTRM